jgi:hypothetical protein
MRALTPGITNIEVAGRLGVTPRTLNNLIYKATKEGWLKFEDPLGKLEYGIIPKAIDNLEGFLNEKDKTCTMETLKGTIFKQYQESKGISDASQTVLMLKIEPAETSEIKVITGTIVGRPRELTE